MVRVNSAPINVIKNGEKRILLTQKNETNYTKKSSNII